MVEPGILPNVNFTIENNCSGKEINIANLSDAPQGDIVYAWDFGNGNTSTERVPKPVYNITTSRTFNVTLKAQVLGGCLDSLVKTVTVFELPKCDFTINDIYKNGHRAFSFTPGVTNYSFYRWTFGDGGNSNQASTEYQYTYDGPFTVTLTARNSAGCECQSTRILNVLNLGVSDVAAAGIRVYPNPATGYLNVDLPAAAANTTVSMLDATGRLVLTEKLGAAQNKLRVEQLPAGLYQVVVTVDGVSSTTRVVVGR
jgi:PKD repeat protein